jgi:hypothetical protein
MIGRADMEIKSMVVDRVNGVRMRQIASALMKAQDNDYFLVLIQKCDSDITPKPYSCVSVVFR